MYVDNSNVWIEGKRVSASCHLWIFTSRAVDSEARRLGYVKTIGDAGGVVITDTCSAFAQAIPPGTKVAALDSAKQAHYLPAITGVSAWFGSVKECVEAALTGRENVSWFARLYDVPRHERKSRVDDALAHVGLRRSCGHDHVTSNETSSGAGLDHVQPAWRTSLPALPIT